MNQREAEEKWDQPDERGHAKWGDLTRAERAAVVGKRRSLLEKALGLPRAGEDEVDRPLGALDPRGP